MYPSAMSILGVGYVRYVLKYSFHFPHFYSPLHGLFTAPTRGVYTFYAQLMGNEAYMHWGIIRVSQGDKTPLCLNHLEGYDGYFDKSTCEATVYLEQGDTVSIQKVDGTGNTVEGDRYCSFSGFLLSADP
jgi:hypothetical protein